MGAALSEGCFFAVLAATETHRSAVCLYGDTRQMTARYLKNAYLTDLALNAEGSQLAMVGLEPVEDDVQLRSCIWLYDAGDEDAKLELSLKGQIPLGCCFAENGDLLVLCSETLLVFGPSGREKQRVALQEYGRQIRFDLNEDGAVLLCERETDGIRGIFSVIAFDKSGNIVYNGSVEGDVSGISRCDDAVFLLQRRALLRVDVQDGSVETLPLDTPADSVVAASSREAYVCRNAAAELVQF
jgi:hypothetical protein